MQNLAKLSGDLTSEPYAQTQQRANCGQMAGAYWGQKKIPDSLKSGLAKIEMIEAALSGLIQSE
ncbi:hypothetical protein [Rubinisphaera italica]|uniref:hypothetical protein n=1 Tax=Rubinisphaera italica TaxID=2527969 RepID=UPI0011B600C3|nr:hypothetical protein [Rubinisphaera italica]